LLVLDVAAGDGDMAREMADWSRRRGFAGSITAIDIIPQILLGDNTFDVAACSLALHHMDRQGAIAMLREMGCMARRGVILNDLVRTWHGYLGTWLLSRLFTRNPLTRYDAPLSVRRAYTLAEMFALAEEAGLKPVASWTFLGYRTATAMRRNP
jgi:hypothetical protein